MKLDRCSRRCRTNPLHTTDIQEAESGLAEAPREEQETFICQLMERGGRYQEALQQFENEQYLSKKFNMDYIITYVSES